MIPITMEDLEELCEGMHEDNIERLKTAYGQVQYVFDELGSGFDRLTAKRMNMLRGRLLCAASQLKDAAEGMEIYDGILESRRAGE